MATPLKQQKHKWNPAMTETYVREVDELSARLRAFVKRWWEVQESFDPPTADALPGIKKAFDGLHAAMDQIKEGH